MQELNDLPLNPISNLPQPNIESPKLQLALETLNTDPRFSSQTNEIFSFRSELHNNFNRLVEIRPIVPEFAIVPTIPVIEEEKQTLEDEKDEDLEEVSHLLLKMVKSNLVFQIFFLFFFANCLWNVDFKFLLGLSWLNDSLNCIICIERLWQTKNQKTGCFLNSKLKLKLFDNLILINYKVFILLFLLYRDFNLCYGILALISQCLAQLFFILYLRFYKKKSILSEFLEFGFRLFVLSQISMVSMNLQGLIHWKWKDIFWCFWVIFSVMSGASLGFGLIFLGKLYQKCFEKVENFEIKGLLWLFATTAGITVNSAYSVSVIGEFFDENGKNTDDVMSGFIGISSYLCFMFFYCLIFHKDLAKFLEKIGSEEDEEEEEISQEDPRVNLDEKLEVKKLKIEKNPSKYFFPSFLKKSSSTYFKAVNASFLQAVSAQIKKQKNSSKQNSKNNSFLTSPPPQLLNQKNDLKKPKLEERSPSFKKQQYPNISEQKGKKNSIMTCGPNFQKPSNNTDKEKNFGVNFSNCDHSISINSCLICFENAPDSVFMDCGHGGMCYVCATDIFKKTGECYLCRNVIKQVLLLDLQDKNDNLFKVKAATRLVTPSEDIYGLKNSEKMYVS